MAPIADTLVSSTSRPLPLRMRPDLTVGRHCFLGRQYWVLKDPLALKYYRFEDEEYAILKMLDGQTSLAQIKRTFEQQFAPQKIPLADLHHFLGTLHRSSLVVSDVPGQGRELFERQRKRRKRERWETLGNFLTLRFKGVDPNRYLTWLDRRCGWFFSPAAGIGWLVFVCTALLLIATQFQVFQMRLPAFHEFFAARNWIWLALVVATTKILHEFGHGLSCKHFGGECHEMGVMLLVGTPCLYCNVTDAWLLPNKWHRAWIGAAGMYVELFLAAIATFLWWFSEPGWLNFVCLKVMFVCSVSTVVFNANPLLRYDGYYILADLLEIPNLRQKATALWQRLMGAIMLGLPQPYDPFLPQRRQLWFASYCAASFVYRWLVTLSLLLFLYKVFEPYGLKIAGQFLVGLSLYGLVFQPLWQIARFFYVPGRIEQVNKSRMIWSVSILATGVVAFFVIPLPHSVRCSFYLQPRGAAAVYVDVPGSVTGIGVRPGTRVTKDQTLIDLENIDLRVALAKLRGEHAQRTARLESLRQRTLAGDESAADDIGSLEQSLDALAQQIQERVDDMRRLTITAPINGVVFSPPATPAANPDSDRLSTWSGEPLEPHNLGAFYHSGTMICRIGDPHQLEAMLAVDQADIDFVRPGQPLDLFCAPHAGSPVRCRVEHVAADDLQTAPVNLSSKHGGDLATRTDSAGNERPLRTTFLASASFVDPAGSLPAHTTGRARICVGYQTVASRVWRYLCHTFQFEL